MDGVYADIMEKALYNGVLSGVSLDGKKYFYVNPLEVWPESCHHRHDKSDVATTRQGWFSCACCPSLGGYIYSIAGNTLYTHLYVKNTGHVRLENCDVAIGQETDYPWDGKVRIKISASHDAEFTVALRIPGWCKDAKAAVNGERIDTSGLVDKGYLKLTRLWKNGSIVELNLPMPVKRVQSNPELRENAGKVAITRGPLVYCLEETDNSERLADLVLAEDPEFTVKYDEGLLDGVVKIEGKAFRSDIGQWGGRLYRELDFAKTVFKITAVPYYAWNNRGEGEMCVWIRQMGI